MGLASRLSGTKIESSRRVFGTRPAHPRARRCSPQFARLRAIHFSLPASLLPFFPLLSLVSLQRDTAERDPGTKLPDLILSSYVSSLWYCPRWRTNLCKRRANYRPTRADANELRSESYAAPIIKAGDGCADLGSRFVSLTSLAWSRESRLHPLARSSIVRASSDLSRLGAVDESLCLG